VAVAALKSFGLFDEIESGGSRTFKVSELGLKIVADKRPDSPEREAAIREAALRPKIHAEIWRKYNGRLPSDAELEYRLENDWNFNKNVIKTFIKELRDTISFANLKDTDIIGEPEGGEGTSVEDEDRVSEENLILSLSKSKRQLQMPPDTRMQEFVVPLSEGTKAIFQWPVTLSAEDILDLKDSLKIVERKITRSTKSVINEEAEKAAE
jgi:hypothetical protein